MRSSLRTAAFLWSLAVTGCASNTPVYKLYPGPHLPESEIVAVRLGSHAAIIIDGLNVSAADYGVVHLAPGRHRLAIGFIYTTVESAWVDPDLPHPVECAHDASEVVLEKGRDYRVLRTDEGLIMQTVDTDETVWRCETS